MQVAEIQRVRLLAGAVGVLDELGYARTTVAHITTRAKVSRRTFYELFANREECAAAVLEDTVGQIAAELAAAGLEDLAWRERIRRGLWMILAFLDREPALARVSVVQALRAGPRVLERRDEILAALVAVVDEGRLEGARGAGCSALTAEGLVGAALAIAHARLLRRQRAPLTDLHAELVGMIVLPYLGPAAARREHIRPAPRSAVAWASRGTASAVRDPFEGVQMRVTYRTARVLEGIAEHPGASNRLVAECAGISDPGQISKLLSRLERLGLLANSVSGRPKGEPNVWTLTAKGERVAQGIRAHAPSAQQAPARRPARRGPFTDRGALPSAHEEELPR